MLESAEVSPGSSPSSIAATTPSLSDVRRWRDDPVAFAREALRVQPWSRQIELLHAVRDNNYVAVRSGHKCSKSNSIAILALWWAITRPGARVVLTAPANHQVENILWPELKLLYAGAALPLGGRLLDDPRSGLKLGNKWGIFGLTTDKPERIAGLSGDKLMFLVDEASGYPEDLFTAVFGNLAGGGKVVLTGNPTQTSGSFFNAFHANADRWKPIHISSEETPNFHGGSVPGLATPEWAAWAAGEWGIDSPLYDVRVRGEFPKQSSTAVIGLSVVTAALARWASVLVADGDVLEIGVDVARFGDDDSVIQPLRGAKAFEPIVVHGLDTVQVAGKVLEVVRRMRRSDRELPIVKVDVIGVGGGVADILRQSREIVLVEVNVAERATEEAEYPNLRSELWFQMAKWLTTGAIPHDSKLEGELVAPVYSFDTQGRRKVESKDDIKKRLKRSPDRADALALAIFSEAPREHVSSFTSSDFDTQGIG
jgi:phage terminase large subunit